METRTDDILWTAGFFNERFPAPVSPLAWSMLGPLIEEIALRDPLRFLGYPDANSIALTRLWHGHPYTNVRAFQIFYKVFPDFLLPEDAYRYFPGGDALFRRKAPYPRSFFSPRFLFSILRTFLADWQNFSTLHNYRKWARYTVEHDRRVKALCTRIDALDAPGAQKVSPEVILFALAEVETAHRDLLRIHRWSLMHADLTFGSLKRMARAWIDSEHGGEIAARAVTGTQNKTMEVDSALQALAALAREGLVGATTFDQFWERATPETREAFMVFLAHHGHRSFTLDLAMPTFADDPMQVVRLLRGMGARGEERKVRSEMPLPVVGPRSPVLGPLYNAMRALAIHYVTLREDQRYYWQKSLALSRRLYWMLAGRLVEERVLEDRSEIFYAEHRELVEHFHGRLSGPVLVNIIRARRSEWEGYRREFEQSPAGSYPLFLRGSAPLADARTPKPVWQARAVSPGTARGIARVVQSPNELGRVQRGEILIAPSTDPAWTPVFSRIAGLVLERGGVLSHGAVVAREYRVPAVAGVANIAHEIRDGDLIEVNGNTGVITRVE